MARVSDDIVITVGGDIGPLTDAVTKADRVLGRLKDSTKKADQQFRAMVGTGTVMQARIEGLAGVTDRLSKSAEASARSFGQFEKAQAQVDRLRASFDPLFAASKRYEEAVKELDRALEMGVLTQTQYNKLVQDSAKHYLSAAGQTGKMGTEMSKAGKSANALQYQVQNASYQVGDFFVQIASGTDASRALAQQLPQLLGGFGVIGAVAGAGAAIGGALVPMLFSAKDGAKQLDKALEGLADAQDRLNKSTSIARSSLSNLVEKYGAGAARVREMALAQMQLNVAVAKSTLAETVAGISQATEKYTSVSAVFASKTKQALDSIHQDFGLTGEAAWELIKRLRELGEETDRNLQMQQFRELVQWLEAAGIELKDMPPEMARAAAAMLDVNIQAEELEATIREATGQTEEWAGAMSSVKSEISGIVAAIASIGAVSDVASKTVELEARRAGKTKAEAVRARKIHEIEMVRRAKFAGGTWYDKFMSGVESAAKVQELDLDDQLAAYDEADRLAQRKGKSKKGGGDRDRELNDIKRRLERMQNDFASEQELAALQHEERHQTLLDARSRELLTEEQFQEMKLKSQEEYLQKMKDLDRLALHEKLAAWSSGLGDLASLMNSGNKKMFQIGKMAAVAQAVVDGWSAATSAWEKGMKIGGPGTAAAFTAMSLARTGAMLASIKSTQFGGGGGGGAGGGAPVPSVPSESPNKVANYQISGDVLGKQSTADLFKSINEGIKDGYTIIDVEWV